MQLIDGDRRNLEQCPCQKGEDPFRTHQGSPLAGYAMFFFQPFSHANGNNKLIRIRSFYIN